MTYGNKADKNPKPMLAPHIGLFKPHIYNAEIPNELVRCLLQIPQLLLRLVPFL